jgi:hypothetical protein
MVRLRAGISKGIAQAKNPSWTSPFRCSFAHRIRQHAFQRAGLYRRQKNASNSKGRKFSAKEITVEVSKADFGEVSGMEVNISRAAEMIAGMKQSMVLERTYLEQMRQKLDLRGPEPRSASQKDFLEKDSRTNRI